MKRCNNKYSYKRLHHAQLQEEPIASKWNMLKDFQKKLNFSCAFFSTLFIMWWLHLIWHSARFYDIGKHRPFENQKGAFSNNALLRLERRMQISHFKMASWDLLGSPKSPSLYTKFNIDGEMYNLEIDTGSFLTWFRCNYKSYQKRIVSNKDGLCKKIVGNHFHPSFSQNEEQDEGFCSYRIVYQDNSYSHGVIVKSNIQVRVTDIVMGVSAMLMDEMFLGCSYEDFNPKGEYKDAIHGLLGLGRSTHGIQASFFKHGLPLYFGICFKDFIGKKDETQVGYIFFGNFHLDSKSQLNWIQISEYYIFGEEAYELTISKLWIEDEISIPINANMMLDTGTPMTFLEANLFETIIHYIGESALSSGYTMYKETIKHFHCWNFPDPTDESAKEMLAFDFPDIKLEFLNGEIFTISPTKYLASYEFVENGFCANMRKFDDELNFPDNTMVLGARMMAEYLIIFDNARDRIGFMPSPNCEYNKKRKHDSNMISSEISPKRYKNDYL